MKKIMKRNGVSYDQSSLSRDRSFPMSEDNKQKHTEAPLPWSTLSSDKYEKIVDAEDRIVMWWPVGACPSEKLRALIVTAVNNYHPLLEALKDALGEVGEHTGTYQKIKQAIANAEK